MFQKQNNNAPKSPVTKSPIIKSGGNGMVEKKQQFVAPKNNDNNNGVDGVGADKAINFEMLSYLEIETTVFIYNFLGLRHLENH